MGTQRQEPRLTRSETKLAAVLGATAALSLCVSSIALGATAPRPKGLTLTSTTFRDGGSLPPRVGFNASNNPNCVGDNVSPQLSWSNAPPGIKSYAITMVTAEVDDINMVVYGIPASTSSLAEGDLSKSSDKFTGGKNRFGQGTWRGMCTPAGSAAHHYIIKLVGSDLDPAELPPGLTLDELQARLKGHFIDSAVLVGTFVHP
jgi:phosphatidylethanolamine-binding protein (PEBP) family uncharacterized protein